jgi:hypothetical protein
MSKNEQIDLSNKSREEIWFYIQYGKVNFDQFDNWIQNFRQDAYDSGYDSGYDNGYESAR